MVVTMLVVMVMIMLRMVGTVVVMFMIMLRMVRTVVMVMTMLRMVRTMVVLAVAMAGSTSFLERKCFGRDTGVLDGI